MRVSNKRIGLVKKGVSLNLGNTAMRRQNGVGPEEAMIHPSIPEF